MRTRQQIQEEIKDRNDKIIVLRDEIIELNKEAVLLCDDKQWFTEEVETHTVGRGKNKEVRTPLIGRINWKQDFKDGDTDNVITIDRSRVVRIDGEWQ